MFKGVQGVSLTGQQPHLGFAFNWSYWRRDSSGRTVGETGSCDFWRFVSTLNITMYSMNVQSKAKNAIITDQWDCVYKVCVPPFSGKVAVRSTWKGEVVDPVEKTGVPTIASSLWWVGIFPNVSGPKAWCLIVVSPTGSALNMSLKKGPTILCFVGFF